MNSILLKIYDRAILQRPLITLFVIITIISVFLCQIPKFKLDASGDSLLLENDTDLKYHRLITERYGTNEILIITYTAKGDLFSAISLAKLNKLRNELRQLDGVISVTTLLDIPLLFNTSLSLEDVRDVKNIKTLENSDVDIETVLAELKENPLYKGRLLSKDKKTTALLITLEFDVTYMSLLKRREELKEGKNNNELSAEETQELLQVSDEYRRHLTQLTNNENRIVENVREIMDRYRDEADLYLGGMPMNVADTIAFIKHDLIAFGIGVIFCLIITLFIIFRKPYLVIISIICCLASILIMIGFLGMMDWRVTIISSNFISLVLILTMALTIHITERYLELDAQSPDANQRTLVLETVGSIILPCLYTALTTIIAFISFFVSGIRPVVDFGLMITIGIIVSFVLSFTLFPAIVMLLEKDSSRVKNSSPPFTLVFARLTQAHGRKVLVLAFFLALFSGLGVTKLKVENKFIDYFRKKTEIYQGMNLIDQKLGGTTPLDLIIDFKEETVPSDEFDDDDVFFTDDEDVAYWFTNSVTMEAIEKIHDYLDELPETGEVLSFATQEKIARQLNNNVPLDGFERSILLNKIPSDIKEMLVDPFIANDVTQARFSMRIIESNMKEKRQILLSKIRNFLKMDMGFIDDQIHFTNVYVLYNNMLQSLFRSQILTLGLVFLGILLMFTIIFKSLNLAIIAIIPNLLPAIVVLGTMGWFNIPLDMMTITIASITIGIAVDDTIHYIYRFQKEFIKDQNYMTTVYRCHGSIGKALFFTSVTIIIGFSVLVLSNFKPTIYFGIFTGFAMLIALMSALILLPQLLIYFKPFGPEANCSSS